MVGLDDAGKTSICHVLQGKPSSTLVPSPTVGFNAPVEVTIHGCSVVVYDVGGSKGIRAIWPEYLAEAHALVFVVDSAAPARFDDAADALESLVEHRYGAGKSVLVLANKADLASAAPAADITDHLRERGHAPRCAAMRSCLQRWCALQDEERTAVAADATAGSVSSLARARMRAVQVAGTVLQRCSRGQVRSQGGGGRSGAGSAHEFRGA